MKTIKTEGIILSRTNFGEADRIMIFLTPDHGKIKAIAKAVRKSTSKLAGGIELFSVSHLTLVSGRGELNTVISTRLIKHFANIVKDLDRTNQGYEFMRLINRNTEESCDSGYFDLLRGSFEALDYHKLEVKLISLWFNMQLLKLTGHEPNLHSDVKGDKLADSESYDFIHERMHFVPKLAKEGAFDANQIKFLRLGFAAEGPGVLARVGGVQELVSATQPLVRSMMKNYIR